MYFLVIRLEYRVQIENMTENELKAGKMLFYIILICKTVNES